MGFVSCKTGFTPGNSLKDIISLYLNIRRNGMKNCKGVCNRINIPLITGFVSKRPLSFSIGNRSTYISKPVYKFSICVYNTNIESFIPSSSLIDSNSSFPINNTCKVGGFGFSQFPGSSLPEYGWHDCQVYYTDGGI